MIIMWNNSCSCAGRSTFLSPLRRLSGYDNTGFLGHPDQHSDSNDCDPMGKAAQSTGVTQGDIGIQECNSAPVAEVDRFT